MRLIVLLAIVFLAALALGVTFRWLLGSGSRARERLFLLWPQTGRFFIL